MQGELCVVEHGGEATTEDAPGSTGLPLLLPSRLALARRLSGVLWAMRRDGTVYDAQSAAVASAKGLRLQAQSIEQQAQSMKEAAVEARRRQRSIDKGLGAARATARSRPISIFLRTRRGAQAQAERCAQSCPVDAAPVLEKSFVAESRLRRDLCARRARSLRRAARPVLAHVGTRLFVAARGEPLQNQPLECSLTHGMKHVYVRPREKSSCCLAQLLGNCASWLQRR
ncbi:hypothetical protein [Sorangium sp. So ce1151]|uniref:hypothetical protein n=1 Tax=Sorangium sp. So ce1151 TaxID=3133332 RepID=UPI003F64283E